MTVTVSVASNERRVETQEVAMLVHPSEFYIGVKRDQYLLQVSLFSISNPKIGDQIAAHIALTDVDGNPRPGVPLTIEVLYVSEEKEVLVQEKQITSTKDPLFWHFDEAKETGEYRIRVTLVQVCY